MKKITKRQYEAKKAALETRLLQLHLQEKDLNDRTIAAEIVPVPQRFIDEFDRITDEEWEIKQALRDLEMTWNTRNWTYNDWQQWDLVTANID